MPRLTEEERLKYKREIEELTKKYNELRDELSELKGEEDLEQQHCASTARDTCR
jgi:flagellar capping protein FliD